MAPTKLSPAPTALLGLTLGARRRRQPHVASSAPSAPRLTVTISARPRATSCLRRLLLGRGAQRTPDDTLELAQIG